MLQPTAIGNKRQAGFSVTWVGVAGRDHKEVKGEKLDQQQVSEWKCLPEYQTVGAERAQEDSNSKYLGEQLEKQPTATEN